MSVVTTKQLISEVRIIASEMPDFVYGSSASCSYFGSSRGVFEGQCCIIGQAFKNLGVDTSRILDAENEGDDPTFSKAVDYGMVDISVGSTAEVSWLSLVQRNQDHGLTWSDAVTTAGGVVCDDDDDDDDDDDE